MKIFNLVDRWMTYQAIRSYLISFLFIGLPIGYLFTQGLSIKLQGWDKYHFDISNMLFIILFDCLLISPLIITYFRHKNKFKNILQKIYSSKNLKECMKVKAKFNYKVFKKGESYDLKCICHSSTMNLKKDEIYIIGIDKGSHFYSLKELINKFELDDIKTQRKLKLEKLKKLW